MRRYIFATHHSMASGLLDTIQFLTSTDAALYDVSAYMGETGDEDLAATVDELFSRFSPEDTVVVMTDIMSGSVNQKFYPHMGPRTFLVSGVNAPLAMQLVLASEEELTAEYVQACVEEARNQIVLINTFSAELSDEDE